MRIRSNCSWERRAYPNRTGTLLCRFDFLRNCMASEDWLDDIVCPPACCSLLASLSLFTVGSVAFWEQSIPPISESISAPSFASPVPSTWTFFISSCSSQMSAWHGTMYGLRLWINSFKRISSDGRMGSAKQSKSPSSNKWAESEYSCNHQQFSAGKSPGSLPEWTRINVLLLSKKLNSGEDEIFRVYDVSLPMCATFIVWDWDVSKSMAITSWIILFGKTDHILFMVPPIPATSSGVDSSNSLISTYKWIGTASPKCFSERFCPSKPAWLQ